MCFFSQTNVVWEVGSGSGVVCMKRYYTRERNKNGGLAWLDISTDRDASVGKYIPLLWVAQRGCSQQ